MGLGLGGVGEGLERPCAHACICSSCVVVKGAISMRPLITCMHNLTYRECGHLCRLQDLVIRGFLVGCQSSKGETSAARMFICALKRTYKTWYTDIEVLAWVLLVQTTLWHHLNMYAVKAV